MPGRYKKPSMGVLLGGLLAGWILFTGARCLRAESPETWTPLGPDSATVFSLIRDPFTPSRWYAGTYFGGLYVSTNSGGSWQQNPSEISAKVIFCIAADPLKPGKLLVGTLGSGVFQSLDAGVTWTPLTNGLGSVSIQSIVFNPYQPHAVLAGGFQGVFRSWDGGATWTDSNGGLTNFPVATLLFDSAQGQRVYAGTSGAGVLLSPDGGTNWQKFSDGLGNVIVNDLWQDGPSGDVYLSHNSGVACLTNGATQWADLSLNLAGTNVNQITALPASDGLFAATDRGIFHLGSSNANAWIQWTSSPPARILVPGNTPGSLFVGALFDTLVVTYDGGTNFIPADIGIQNRFVASLMTLNAAGQSALYAGTDVGVQFTSEAFRTNGILPWITASKFRSGVFRVATPNVNSNIIFAAVERDGVWKGTNYGKAWAPCSEGMWPRFIYSLSQSAVGNHTVFAGTSDGVYISTNNGLNWTPDRNTATPHAVTAVLADPVRTNTVYYATSDGNVFRSFDAGQTFQLTWQTPNGDGLLQLAAAPYFNLYAIGSSQKLYVSSDNGGSFFPDTTISNGVVSLAPNPARPWIAYAGTVFGGVYVTTNNAITWQPSNQGLTIPIVYSLAVDPVDDRVVYAGSLNKLFKSTNSAATWFESDVGLGPGAVVRLQIDPNQHSNVFASVGDGGIYHSVNSGDSWSALLSGSNYNFGAPLIASAQTNSKTLLAGSERTGIMRSDDGGLTWSNSSQGMTIFVYGLAIDQMNPLNMYAGSLVDGLFKSSDGGQSWSPKGLADRTLYGLAVDPVNPNNVFAATSSGVSSSPDYGETWFERGQQTAYVFDVLSDPAHPGHIFESGAQGDVFQSTDGGRSWTDAGHSLPRVNIISLAADWSGGLLYAAAEQTGIYQSSDAGRSWSPARGSPSNQTAILRLAVLPNNGNVLAGTDHGGVLLSTNHGAAWLQVGLADRDQVNDFAFDPATNRIYAATSSGVARSSDGGRTWKAIGQQAPYILSLAVDPRQRSTLYTGTIGGRVFRSLDGGKEWTEVDNGLPGLNIFALAVDPVSGFLFASPERAGIYRSVDGGASWTQTDTSVIGSAKITSLSVDASAAIFASSDGSGLFISRDGGTTWRQSGPSTNAQVFNIDFDQAHPGLVYAGTSLGVERSTDGGQTWSCLGQRAPEVCCLISDPNNRSIVYAGSLSGAVYRSTDAGLNWSSARTGLPDSTIRALAIDVQSETLYAALEQPGLYASTNNGSTWARVDTAGLSNSPPSGLAVTVGATRMYEATLGSGILRSLDGGQTWAQASTGLGSVSVSSVALDPFTPDRLYASTLNVNGSGAGVYASSDAGQSWAPITNGLPNDCPLQIEPSPHIPGRLYMVTTNQAFWTEDGGQSWKPIGGLPKVRVLSIAVDESSTNQLFLGTDQGVFRQTNAGSAWLATTSTFATPAISSFAQGPDGGSFYAGSMSNGVFTTKDSGANWFGGVDPQLASLVVLQVVVDPSVSGVLHAMSASQGYIKSIDGGATWERTGAGLDSTNLPVLLADPTRSNRLYAGSHDSGVYVSEDGGAHWARSQSEFATLSVSALALGSSSGAVYVGSLGNGLLESFDAGTTLDGGVLPELVNANLLSLANESLSPTTFYAGFSGGMLKSIDGALTWRYAGDWVGKFNIHHIAVDSVDTNRVLVAAQGAGIFVSVDGGKNWTNSGDANGAIAANTVCNGGSPGLYFAGTLGNGLLTSSNGGLLWAGATTPGAIKPIVLNLALNPQAPQQIFAATAGDGVLVSQDGGASWASATNGLEDLQLFAVAVDSVATNVLYAATASKGVFVSETSGASWRPLTNGLFNPVVTSLAIDVNDHSLVYAGTEGGGVFRLRKLPAAPLQIQRSATGLAFAWPSAWSGFSLQQTPTLTPPDWQTVPYTPIGTNGQYVLTVTNITVNSFFRLKALVP